MAITDIEEKKFVYTFWFCVGMAAGGLLLLTGLIFGAIPKENQQMANVALGFITGTLVTGVMQYLIGGNPSPKKPDAIVQQTGDKPSATVNP